MKDIYLDGAANTPLDPDVLISMKPYLSKSFVGNASATHDYGMKAAMSVESNRVRLGNVLGVNPDNIIFNSGATEGNNTAIKSLVFSAFANGDMHPHIICSQIEHSSVMNACKQMEELGCIVHYVKPDKDGRIHKASVVDAVTGINGNILLICLMAVNNELGTKNPITDITKYAKKCCINTLVDCTQSVSYGGRYIELGKMYPYADMMTFSSHKIYGPEGVGCLIVNDKECLEKIKKYPLMSGGSQEHGARGGTYNVAGIAGMVSAAMLLRERPLYNYYGELFEYLMFKIDESGLPIHLNAYPDHKNIISLNLSALYEGDSVSAILAMAGIACSSGSACDATHDETAGDFNPSHTLTSIGLTEKDIRGTIRISFTKYTTKEDIDALIEALKTLK